MARILALEWDTRQARVAVAQTRGKEVRFEHAFAVELKSQDGENVPAAEVGPQLAAALAARGIGRVETLVAVGRASIELRLLSLPAAPPEELPDMVRFQAMRQFTAIGEDWPLDFVPLETGEHGSHVLAAAISPDWVRQVQQTCQTAELIPKRLVLRPFAAASLLRRQESTAGGQDCLMVDLLTDEADLTVLAADGHVVFMRTVRLPAESEGEVQVRQLVSEIRRTLGAAQNQMGGRRVQQVILCGDGREHASLKALVEQQLGLEVDLFDPFSRLSLGRELQQHRPDYPGRFAPLLGMLLDEATDTGHALDFLHPRQRPAPPNRRRRNALLATTATALLLAVALLVWGQLRALDRTIADLQQELTNLNEPVQRAEKRLADLQEIEEFTASDVTWLDELQQLSLKFPAADDALLTQITFAARSPRGGQIALEGYARQSETVSIIEPKLRDSRHRVFGDGGHEDQRREKYRWHFKKNVLVEILTEDEQEDAEALVQEPTPEVQDASSEQPIKAASRQDQTSQAEGEQS